MELFLSQKVISPQETRLVLLESLRGKRVILGRQEMPSTQKMSKMIKFCKIGNLPSL